MKRMMAGRQMDSSSTTHILQELHDSKKHTSVETTRREEIIRSILLKKSSLKDELSKDSSSLVLKSHSFAGSHDETQLSENIEVLVSRLAEVEEECQQLKEQHKALQDSHSLCAPTISMLKEQLNRSHQTQVELRTVLTAEVAQRHDQIVDLHDELKEHEQKQHETRMQLHLKNEIIKDLRREIKSLKTNSEVCDKGDLIPAKESKTPWETKCAETQTSEVLSNEISSEQLSRTSSGCYSNASQSSQVSKLENELAEKSILLRELQSHLAASRQELHLKDETLYKLEQKLDSSRRDGGEKGERMHYLTSQLTNLQLEVGRTHGQAEQLRRQVENKNELIQKLEMENSSMTRQLNDKSSTLERFQTELMKISTELDNKKKEASEQRLTISALQDALVSSKRSCDELRSRLSSDVSASMLHHSQSQQMHNNSNNPLASTASPSVNKCISLDTLSMQPPGDVSDACLNNNDVSCNPLATAAASPSASGFNVGNSLNDELLLSNTSIPHSSHLQDNGNATENVPALRSNQSAKEATTQTTPSAFAPDVLSSCSGNSFSMNPASESSPHVTCLESDETAITPLGTVDSLRTTDEKASKESVGEAQRHTHSGQVYDV